MIAPFRTHAKGRGRGREKAWMPDWLRRFGLRTAMGARGMRLGALSDGMGRRGCDGAHGPLAFGPPAVGGRVGRRGLPAGGEGLVRCPCGRKPFAFPPYMDRGGLRRRAGAMGAPAIRSSLCKRFGWVSTRRGSTRVCWRCGIGAGSWRGGGCGARPPPLGPPARLSDAYDPCRRRGHGSLGPHAC